MTEFEQQLKKALKGDAKMAMEPEVRGKIDAAYGKIRKQQKRRRLLGRLGIVAAVLLVAGGIFSQTTPGASALAFIQMKFFPQSVLQDNFVREENLVAVDQDVSVTLERIYVDDIELGFTLAIDYSKNQEMVKNEDLVEEFWLRMRIKTTESVTLDEGSMSITPHLDTANHVMSYFMAAHPANFAGYATIAGLNITIDKISGFEKNENLKQGFDISEVYAVAKGNWNFTVANKDMEKFAGISYKQKNQSELPVAEGIAYPSGFVVKISDAEKRSALLRQRTKEGKDNRQRLRVEQNGETNYYEWNRGYQEGNITYGIFDYTGYKEDANIYLEQEGFDDVVFQVAQ